MKFDTKLRIGGFLFVAALYAVGRFTDSMPGYVKYSTFFLLLTAAHAVFLPRYKKYVYFLALAATFSVFMVAWSVQLIADPAMVLIGFFLLGIQFALVGAYKNYGVSKQVL